MCNLTQGQFGDCEFFPMLTPRALKCRPGRPRYGLSANGGPGKKAKVKRQKTKVKKEDESKAYSHPP
jgi:hypothetical protein